MAGRRVPRDAVALSEPPDGPARAHLDLHVDEVPAGAAEAVSRGASVVHEAGDLVVLRSPAGIVFCASTVLMLDSCLSLGYT